MTIAATLDTLFDASPDPFSASFNIRSILLFLSLALGSWALGEAVMAPILQPMVVGLWFMYIACFFIFTAWYFRVSRLLDAPWVSYKLALAPMVWTLTPLHAVLPTALFCIHAGFTGVVIYEIVKAWALLAVLARLMHVFQSLNQWPRWSALVLALSPLAVAFMGGLVMVMMGALAIMSLGLNALH